MPEPDNEVRQLRGRAGGMNGQISLQGRGLSPRAARDPSLTPRSGCSPAVPVISPSRGHAQGSIPTNRYDYVSERRIRVDRKTLLDRRSRTTEAPGGESGSSSGSGPSEQSTELATETPPGNPEANPGSE